ncbi:chemotaxis protein CheD [Desulfoglaeba alkanexedens]|uniref:Probable chemoreceptor glutamine deamidase CheD n=1 Tax=Desulfoglaeba alkanexedens ALDC TaxID=980445 RepID=A0A4P8L3X9_9BACT|nr:chemotaxis protein CheD [Desulfoglaeba alkanexedens]QCQ22677.1 chemotaxis protein CheD [Desulfoglaeba alkanexedens ALDC]
MQRVIIRVADMAVSNRPDEILITYSLGSCIAVVIYDPRVRVGGILHYMLPESSMDPEKAKRKPAMFADTGIPMLFKASYALGAQKKNLTVKVVGGAHILDENGVFNIGKRNYMALRKIFWRNNVLVSAEHVGGSVNRTVRLMMDTGQVILKVSGLGEMEL